MRPDLALSLKRSGIDPSTLRDLHRIFLTTDGTVTDILEAHHREEMTVEVLRQEIVDPATLDERESSGLSKDGQAPRETLRREILLRGQVSGRCALAAQSVIALDRLSDDLRHGLLDEDKPIGHLILRHRIATFKEIVECHRERSGPLGKLFGIRPDAPLLCRTYVVSIDVPIMLITEKLAEWG